MELSSFISMDGEEGEGDRKGGLDILKSYFVC